MQRWTPNFRADMAVISTMVVWARFPNLPAEYLDEEACYLIAKQVGKPVKLDEMTAYASRGRYARICVQVEIDKPLLSRVQIAGKFVTIEYEGLPTICYSCGRIGHRKENCPYTITPVVNQVSNDENVQKETEDGGLSGGSVADQSSTATEGGTFRV